MRLLTICLLLLPLDPLAQIMQWRGTDVQQQIGRDLMIMEDPTGIETIETVAAPYARIRYNLAGTHRIDFQHSSSVYWMWFRMDNPGKQALLLELGQPLLPKASLYYREGNQWKTIEAGASVPLYKKPLSHHYQLFPLPVTDSVYYLRIQANGNPIPISVWSKEAYDIKIQNQKITFGIFMGIMLFVILINVFLFFALGRWAYLHYAFLVFMYATFSALYDGYILYLFPNLDLVYWDMLNPIVNQPNGLLYCIFFLNVRKWAPGLYKPAMLLFLYYCSFILWYRYLPVHMIFSVTQAHALLGILVMAALGIVTGRNGNRLGYYFALAYFVFFAIASIEVIYLQTGRPAHIFDLSYVSISIFFEVFLLLLLLSKRFQWEKQEMEAAKAEAQRRLLEETRKNEQIVREQNLLLEMKVQERTEQLQQANQDLNRSLQEIEREKEKSEALLLNILPAEVADELKEKGSADAHLYENVTVLFSDFVNFTGISERLGPKELVQRLDFYFKKFDEIIGRHGLEKIKTIGDAYLAVCGLPSPHTDHARRVAEAAMDIIRFIEDEGGDFKIRIGIHSGPVVAGIVGVKKFAYDIWGDTVNIAARMEQHSETGRINVSEDTHAILAGQYRFSFRGRIRPKNSHEIDMYFLEGRNA